MKRCIVRKKHVNHSVDFTVENPRTLQTEIVNGRILRVNRGIVSIQYWLPWSFQAEGYVTYLEVNDFRLRAIY